MGGLASAILRYVQKRFRIESLARHGHGTHSPFVAFDSVSRSTGKAFDASVTASAFPRLEHTSGTTFLMLPEIDTASTLLVWQVSQPKKRSR
jgi:hypothetical protein